MNWQSCLWNPYNVVRVVHLPTGMAAICSNYRSQHQNREAALLQLKSKLYGATIPQAPIERVYELPDSEPYPDDITKYAKDDS